MSKKFYPLVIKGIEKTTPECSLITFEVGKEVEHTFKYEQGQHLTLKANVGGEELRRSYSLCSSPLDGEWRVAVKQVPGGRFSTYANDVLKAGDTVEVMPPNGRFFIEINKERQKNYVAFAAGSGITPIFSIIKTHLLAEPKSTFKLFYVNQSVGSIILKEEIEGLKNLFMDRFEVFHFLTRQERDVPLFNGRIDKEKLDIIFKSILDQDLVDDYFLCGPEEMVFLIRDYLQANKIGKKNIHFELFGTKAILQKNKTAAAKKTDGKTCEVTIHEGGKSFNFRLAQGTENILDAALKKAADLPFACKGGVCASCRAKLLEGKVDMALNYALEQEEIEAGYVLTCQAVPVSDKVVVDFDT
ncbi:MAG TPA: phenylacetate-CoA oxygenase/reductase subunit PaaK [Bacteroidetes bacterium]|nr:phenylacetate-CoA oxygenase/reductase subunit PaaK [Bacteroidota bacterium]